MTLCVAAACQDRGRPRVIIGTDWEISDSTARSEIQDKLHWLTDEIPVLMAGTIARAVHLIDTFRQSLEDLQKSTGGEEGGKVHVPQHQLTDFVTSTVGAFKHKLADEYCLTKYGITYARFRQVYQKGSIPEGLAIDTYKTIGAIGLDCSLILVFFTAGGPSIYTVYEDGSLEISEHFSAIGSGDRIAAAVLHQREHRRECALGPSLYHVHEAMTLGAKAPGVGESQTINILHPPVGKQPIVIESLTDRGERFLDLAFRKYGPKPFKRLALPKGAMEI